MRPKLLLLTWLITDLALFIASFALAYFLRVGWIFSSDFPLRPYLTVVMLVAPLWLLILLSTRTVHLLRSQWTLTALLRILYANVIGVALFALGYYFLYYLFFSRFLLLIALALSTLSVWGWHLLFEAIARRMLRRDPPAFPTLIIGATREARRLIELLQKHRNPLKPVAVLDGRGTPEKELAGVPVLGKLDKLEHTLRSKRISHLIQCSDLEQTINLLSACRRHNITYILLPSVLGVVERDERVESLEGWAVTMVKPEGRRP